MNEPMIDLKLLDTREVAALLGVKPEYVMKHCTVRQPLIKSIRLGRYRRFRREDIHEFIERQRDHNPRGLTESQKRAADASQQ